MRRHSKVGALLPNMLLEWLPTRPSPIETNGYGWQIHCPYPCTVLYQESSLIALRPAASADVHRLIPASWGI